MTSRIRLVLDTNIVVSAALRRGSTSFEVLRRARIEGILLASDDTLSELREVLLRSKFDRYVDRIIREELYGEYERNCTLVQIPSSIRACRDPRDDKFLEIAVHGRADVLITGDKDLLVLHPYLGIAILAPSDFLKAYPQPLS